MKYLSFFRERVDEHSNQLVLAVSVYMVSEWFNTCARIYTIIGEKLIFPYMDLLGIDKAQKVKNPNRNWNGIRNFFKEKIPSLQTFVAETKLDLLTTNLFLQYSVK